MRVRPEVVIGLAAVVGFVFGMAAIRFPGRGRALGLALLVIGAVATATLFGLQRTAEAKALLVGAIAWMIGVGGSILLSPSGFGEALPLPARAARVLRVFAGILISIGLSLLLLAVGQYAGLGSIAALVGLSLAVTGLAVAIDPGITRHVRLLSFRGRPLGVVRQLALGWMVAGIVIGFWGVAWIAGAVRLGTAVGFAGAAVGTAALGRYLWRTRPQPGRNAAFVMFGLTLFCVTAAIVLAFNITSL